MTETPKNKEIFGKLGKYSISFTQGQYQIGIWVEKLKNDSYLPLVSQRDSQREAQKILSGFELKKGLIVLVMGMASLPLIEMLIKQKQKNGGFIILFEADSKLAEFISNNFLTGYDDIPIITFNNKDRLSEFLEVYSAAEVTGYRVFSLASSKKLAPDFYIESEIIFKKAFSSLFSDLLTRLEFEPNWIYNSFLQVNNFQKALPVKNLFSKGSKLTAALISTGPSLRGSLEIIKSINDSVFIACVDSAYRVLYRYGIRPHLIISLDAQPYTTRHFSGLPKGEKNEFPILYADMVSNPNVVNNWHGPLFMGITAQYRGNIRTITPGCDFIEEQLLKNNPVGDIQSGGSVATSLFDLLRLMNFENILLFGQDLAYCFREIHSMGTHHSDKWFSSSTHRLESIENINNKVLQKRHISLETSIQNKKIPADYVLSLYGGWLSEAISQTSINVYNMTIEGLPVNNTKKILSHDLKKLAKKTLKIDDFISLEKGNTILNNNEITKFYKDIAGISFSKDIILEYGFLEKIGRKYFLGAERKQNDAEKKEKLLEKQYTEQKKFWDLLRKKSKKILALLDL